MLPQENRLRRMKDFEILYKEGKFVAGKFLNIKIWKIEPEKYPRRDYKIHDLKIGFVVSKKVSKSAVKRNRVKRQMREVVRLLLKDGKLRAGYHVAVIAKANIVGAECSEIDRDVRFVFGKVGLMSLKFT